MATGSGSVQITSPAHAWLGTHGISNRTDAIAVLIGKATGVTETASSLDMLRKQIADQEPTAFFFEKKDGVWTPVPVELIGMEPWVFDGALAANFLNYVDACVSNDAQRMYLAEAGVAIDGEFVQL